MRISRIRLRLSASLALVFLFGLVVLNLALFAFLRAQASHRLTRNLAAEARQLSALIETEHQEEPQIPLAVTARTVMLEWPSRETGFALLSDRDPPVIGGNPADSQALARMNVDGGPVWNLPGGGEHDVRLVASSAPPDRYRVVAASSTRAMDEELESLALWMGVSVPIMIVLSIMGGYFLAGKALHPVRVMGGQLATLDAEGLRERLPLAGTADEIDVLAGQINGLLERLAGARQANRRFLRQAAHQIQTPLTLVLGEATLSLDRPRSTEEQRAAVQRIRMAAEQMRRRVAELFLLAQARSGELIDLTQEVELDGLVLECTDLMRSRFTLASQRLELADVEPLIIRGNEWLLREAVLELLENACRYSVNSSMVTAGVSQSGDHAVITVSNPGPPIPSDASQDSDNESRGMGLQIVRWITEQHGGELRFEYGAGLNASQCRLPLPE
ncbi:MAG: HAMP domain-containing sensor histidine kinase [Gemmatimonadota bacterium]